MAKHYIWANCLLWLLQPVHGASRESNGFWKIHIRLLEKAIRENIEGVRDYKRSEVSWCKQAAPAAADAWVDFSTCLLNLCKQIKHNTETPLFQHCHSLCWALDSPFSLTLHLSISAISADQRNTSVCLQQHMNFWMEVTVRESCKKKPKQLFLACAVKQHNSYFFHDLH